MSTSGIYTKPFLKWAGGKYRILEHILPILPAGKRLIEPFAGSAAVYLNSSHPGALVCDLNTDLVSLYQHLQEQGQDFIRYCQSFFTSEGNTAKKYYLEREQFNSSVDPAERAALLLYLNRHSFNGLIRYNAGGKFNVPFGRYKKPYFPYTEMLAFHKKAKNTNTQFMALDFREVFSQVQPGDVLYCDPPYVPLSATAHFTTYAGKNFTLEDQQSLSTLATQAAKQGITVIISNHDTPLTRKLYKTAKLHYLSVQRFISCDPKKRTPVAELLAIYQKTN